MASGNDVNAEQIKSFRDFLLSYNKLSEVCFVDCISDFTSRTIKPNEEKCALNCTEKYLKMNQRISQRFQEFQMVSNENLLAAQKAGGQ
ncbi:translocase of inner membrane 9 [Rhodnius prolixus]|uniref:Mitochondrial import inner membrane translocase subunit n=2 Tax=Rhodnius TaxID=13248 RepID=R4FJR0_RHOPR